MRSAALLCSLVLGAACGSRSVTPPPPTPTPPPAPASAGAPPTSTGASSTGARPPGGDGRRCDPMSGRTPAPPPPATGAVCGNGVIEALAGTCEEVCHGGCDGPIECRIECTTPREDCDGADVGFTCESQGYAGGRMACTKACLLDDGPCVACVPGPGVRCGAAALVGDEAYAVAAGTRAAVFVRDADTGRITGAKVDPRLRARAFAGLPRRTLAAGAIDGGVGYVDARHRFGVIDVAGRARLRGPIGADSTPILILQETFEPGGAAVLTGDYMRRTLAVFDPPGAAATDQPRHFYLGNLRVVVVPGAHELARGATTGGADLAVIAFGNELFAYQRDGLELIRLPAVPAGLAFAFTYPAYTDRLPGASGERVTTRLTNPDTNAPPPGLSRAALSGVSTTAAFGGVLIANPHRRGSRPRTELYWLSAPDPLAPSR